MLSGLHTIMAWVVVIGNGLAGAWCLLAHSFEGARHRALWPFVTAVQIALFVQVALGVARLSQLDGDPPQFHTFYGFLCLIAVAILYGYRSQLSHLRYALYGGGSLFIMGLAIRAMFLDAAVLGAAPVTA